VHKKKKGLDNLHYQDLSVGGPDGKATFVG
jgi:hypothetical protein